MGKKHKKKQEKLSTKDFWMIVINLIIAVATLITALKS
jgi:hypothetical protein